MEKSVLSLKYSYRSLQIRMKKKVFYSKAGVPAILVLFEMIGFGGCQNSSSPPPATPPHQPVQGLTWKVPGVGSLFVETHYHGSLKFNLQGTEDAHYWVGANGYFAGKSTTFKLDSSGEYISFETNGDYSVLDSLWGFSSSDWQRFPTAGGSPIVQTSDTTYSPDGILYFDTTQVQKYATRSYIGVENITDADGITYATFKIHEVTIESETFLSSQHPSTPQTTILNTDYWIAPAIGWIVKDSSCDGTDWTSKLLAGCTVY
jgi:hypothetical protein